MRSSRDQLEALRTMSIGIIEKRIFSGKRFDEMLQWCDERKQRELHLQVSGILHKLPSKDPIDVEGRLIGTRKGLFTKRIAILVESLDKPLQEMGLGNIITIGGEGARNEDVAAKKILVFELVKRDLHEDVYYDGDQINEAVKFITSVGKTEDFNVEVWGKDFKTRKPAYLKGRLINARVEFPNIELLELMVEGRSDEEEIVTVGGHEPPAISILQSSLDRVQPDLIAEKLYFWPIYSPETLRFADIVEANNITVRLGGKMIIENVSFSIREGEIMGIVGESGAGKTTMIKALIREFEPESGTASIAGINTSNLSKVKPLLGFVPQELSKMYEDFTPIENIVTFGKQYGIPEFKLIERGKQLLRDFGIFQKGDDPVKQLSGGEKRRVSVAISLAHYPRLLILDEPTSGLDPDRRHDFWKYLDKINREYGTSMIVVSHYPEEMEFCDKVGVFIKGKSLYAFGTPQELKASLPGGGYSVGVFLEEVHPHAVEMLESITGVRYVLQRGELMKLFSTIPLKEISEKAVKVLSKQNIPIRSIEPRLEVDMTDYFITVSRGLLD